MSEINEIDTLVITEVPKVLENEQIYVYVDIDTIVSEFDSKLVTISTDQSIEGIKTFKVAKVQTAPKEDDDVVRLNELNKKVDKVSTKNVVYTNNDDGVPSSIQYSLYADWESIALRTSTGTLKASDGKEDDECVTVRQIKNKEHFKGYFATTAEIKVLAGEQGDFAYNAQTGTKWVYNVSSKVWEDTTEKVPDQVVPKSETTPLMNGTPQVGSENKYAAGDHVHPTDTSRASTAVATTSANGLMSSSDKTKLDGIESGAQKNTVTGIKGDSESSYRTGNVNITKSNIGLDNVDNVRQYSASNPNFSSTAPVMDGTAAVGSATTYARSDHKHPTDTTRAAKADLAAVEVVDTAFSSLEAIATTVLSLNPKVLRVSYTNIPTTLITPPSGINYGDAFYLFRVLAKPSSVNGTDTLGVIEVTFENISTQLGGVRPIGYIRQGKGGVLSTWWFSDWSGSESESGIAISDTEIDALFA